MARFVKLTAKPMYGSKYYFTHRCKILLPMNILIIVKSLCGHEIRFQRSKNNFQQNLHYSSRNQNSEGKEKAQEIENRSEEITTKSTN